MTSQPCAAWRLARVPYADLSGHGAELYGGRWNSPGRPAVYLSAEAALPVLEVLVHLDLPPDLIPKDYTLMRLDLAPLADMPNAIEDATHIAGNSTETRLFGDTWLAEGRTPILRVASRVVAEASNLILNPRHVAAQSLPPPTRRPFSFDPRLFSAGR